MGPPTAEGGRLRAQDIRTPGDPTGLSGAADPDRSRHGRGGARQPDFSSPTRTSAGSSPTACATRSGWRSGPARTTSTWASRRQGVPAGRRSTACRTRSRRRSATSAGPATRAALRERQPTSNKKYGAYDALEPRTCARPCTRRAPRGRPFWAYKHTVPVVPGETCHEHEPRAAPGSRSRPRAATSRRSTRARFFFADYCARLHLGDAGGARTACPIPPPSQNFAQGSALPRWTSSSAPTGDLYYADIADGAIQRINFTGGRQPAAHRASPRPTPQGGRPCR